MPSLRCLTGSVTSLRSVLLPATHTYGPTLLRASYSNSSTIGSSKRLLQTHTHATSSLQTDLPFPRAGGSPSLATTPRDTSMPGSPPPVPVASPTTRTKFRPRKAAMALSPHAVGQLRTLLEGPDPKMIRVGVKNRGCSGLAYHLEYVDKPGKFDEEVVQDGVKVLIDSKALFSIIGSEMDWVEDKLSSRFVFKNPNIKEQCGCGESFSIS